MSSLTDVNASICVEDRAAGIHRKCQCTAGKDKIKIRQNTVIRADLFNILRGLFAETGENDLNFFLFFRIQFFEVVVQFYDCHRLDKQCRTGGGLIVDHPVDLTAVLGFDRNTIAVPAHGDDRILQIGAQRTVHQICQSCMNFIVDVSDATADIL